MGTPLICDFGSGSSKVGFSGAEEPLAVFPTVLGKLRCDDAVSDSGIFQDPVGLDKKVWFIGDEVQKQRGRLNLAYPVSRGEVTNWEHMEKIWHHTFYQVLRVAPEQHPMLLTDLPSNSKANKERMAQVLFETFSMPALYIVNQGVLSLFSAGLTSGTTIECGEGMTHFVPVFEGCPLHLSTMQMDVAGQDITLYLMQLLSRRGNSLLGIGDREYIRGMKEKCCYVALDFDKEKAAALSVSLVHKHQLPDGREVEFGMEHFLCMEALFQPDFIGRNSLGAHMIALRSISSCSPALQKTLFRNVLLSGGTGSSPSLRARMQQELSALVSPTTNVKVSTCPSSVYSAWVGGSVLCSLSTFKDMWVTIEDYYEKGPSALSERSF
ncbi:actin-like [Pipistrellus kuhlii]|uniref:actin-like n=1 Tax=Pipistrellus kuhlii TaxID=59472 RepID=UPI001E2717DF|nr:actin-like [Pipistrellus kuhlii]